LSGFYILLLLYLENQGQPVVKMFTGGLWTDQ